MLYLRATMSEEVGHMWHPGLPLPIPDVADAEERRRLSEMVDSDGDGLGVEEGTE